jgi:hypothetical protein
MKFFKRGLRLPFWLFFAQCTPSLHLISRPAVIAHTFPALAVFQNASAICKTAQKEAFELIGIQHRRQLFSQ